VAVGASQLLQGGVPVVTLRPRRGAAAKAQHEWLSAGRIDRESYGAVAPIDLDGLEVKEGGEGGGGDEGDRAKEEALRCEEQLTY